MFSTRETDYLNKSLHLDTWRYRMECWVYRPLSELSIQEGLPT